MPTPDLLLTSPKLQIHIAGTTRSGKTTLGLNLVNALTNRGYRATLLDIDHTRTSTFGDDEPILGTLSPDTNADHKRQFALQKQMQGWSYNNVFFVQIPLVTHLGAIPIFTATHARRHTYDLAEQVAQRLGNTFYFLLLDDPGLDEVARRCCTDTSSTSDMHDPLHNKTERDNYLAITHRLADSYTHFHRPLHHIRQASQDAMLADALSYLFSK